MVGDDALHSVFVAESASLGPDWASVDALIDLIVTPSACKSDAAQIFLLNHHHFMTSGESRLTFIPSRAM